MDATVTKRIAWQPLTPRGVAAFAEASFDRFQIAKLLIALFCSCTVVVFLWATCDPVILETMQAMPETAHLDHGVLTGIPGPVLKEGHIVSILFDPESTREVSPTKDIQLAFGRTQLDLCVLKIVTGPNIIGCLRWQYPHGWNVPLGRSVLEPWWGAWRGMVFAAIGLAVFLALVFSWVFLAMIYAVPVRLLAFAARRRITWPGSWRLAGAALMPGALFLSLGLLACGFYLIDLIRLLLIFILHFVIGWAYLIAAPLTLDRLESWTEKPAVAAALDVKTPNEKKNPFAS